MKTMIEVQATDYAEVARALPENILTTDLANSVIEMQGVAASPGCHVGRARVAHGELDLQELQAGDVLVWAGRGPISPALLRVAGALVIGVGGLLSSSATIAREYQLPAVVGIGSGINLLRDGQVVEVDGSQGFVRVRP
jgi:phosphohistidine swiveling domain-containing protein